MKSQDSTFLNLQKDICKYFLDREASSQIFNLEERDRFNKEIEKHINKISQHAFETSKITQSFAAGWFNKNVKGSLPSKRKIEAFLNIAFGKMKRGIIKGRNKLIESDTNIVLCNGAKLPKKVKVKNQLILEYDDNKSNQNVKIKLNDFVTSVLHLDKRIKDLLEIAGYVYAADRKMSRGNNNLVEYQKWSRKFHFFIKVRDYKFWNQTKVKNALNNALCFLSGDLSYDFTFIDGGSDFPANLFDDERIILDSKKNLRIILFSGGLDSLAGIIDTLETTNNELCLVSHQSGQPGIKRTQNVLFSKLNQLYDNRCKHYKFKCSLTKDRAIEETQRTRSFLFCTIAFAISIAHSQKEFYVYENGITSINFSKRQDLINARASRTTHPKALKLLETFYNLVYSSNISIKFPFLFKTKTDIVSILKCYKKDNLIDSSVSCSKTFQNTSQFTHCGECSQCIDRRFAMYGASAELFDENGIYEFDFLKSPIDRGTTRTAIVDYMRLADKFSKLGVDSFYYEFLNELTDIEPYIDGNDEEERIEKIYELCRKHSEHISFAIEKMRQKYDLPFNRLPQNSFFNSIVGAREYHKSEPYRLSDKICQQLEISIPKAFSSNKPKDEKVLNNYVDAFISQNKNSYEREFPFVKFALSKAVPDHSFSDENLFIESKYIRGKTSPSKITSGISEDLTKYPGSKLKLFIIYDPERQITDDNIFIQTFEEKGNCKVKIIR